MTVFNIPFWDVFAAELAWRHLTTAVAATSLFQKMKLRVKPFVLTLQQSLKALFRGRPNDSGCASWPSGPVILCLGLTPRMYRDVLEPVAQLLATEHDCDVVVLEERPNHEGGTGGGGRIKHELIWRHWDAEAQQLVGQLTQSLREVEAALKDANILSHLLPEQDGHMVAAVGQVFRLLFRYYLPQILPLAAVARHALIHHRPTMLLSPDTSDARTRIYTLMARQMGIPTMEVQFGMTADESVEWRFLPADCVAVWGEEAREALLKQNVPHDRILLTGSPRHDALVHPSAARMSALRASLGLTDHRPVILLASTYVDRTHAEYARPEVLLEMRQAIFEAARNHPGIVLVVKPHPHEQVKETSSLAGDAPNIIFADRASDIRDLIAISDAFMSFGSTATIDALIADKPCICPIFPGWPFSENFRVSGALFVPETREQISDLFARIAAGESMKDEEIMRRARAQYLDRVAYKADGLAAFRIGNRVAQMAGITPVNGERK
jgi:hypothetical protein